MIQFNRKLNNISQNNKTYKGLLVNCKYFTPNQKAMQQKQKGTWKIQTQENVIQQINIMKKRYKKTQQNTTQQNTSTHYIKVQHEKTKNNKRQHKPT